VEKLTTQVQRMRKFYGRKPVYAQVRLSKVLFSKRYNRTRPHLEILKFLTPTDQGFTELDANTLLDSQQAPVLKAMPGPTASTSAQQAPPWKEAREPSLREEMDDDIPFK
jgi:hypothetical protein